MAETVKVKTGKTKTMYITKMGFTISALKSQQFHALIY